MTLSEELTWRGLVYQTTYKDITVLDRDPRTFYWGVDPTADSMTLGNLAAAMMVKCFMKHGYRAVLLVGGATGLVGDPDGKSGERGLKSPKEVAHNKTAITAQYRRLFEGRNFKVVDNYEWFKDIKYIDFLRDVGKYVPMRQMLAREFLQSRLGDQGNGISYAEFSYVLIQAYDFLHLYQNYGVTLQVCGSDQWGNSIAGVELIRRKTGGEAHVYAAPLIINKTSGKKFGKTEEGAVWLDPEHTTPTQFYQFWINADDNGAEEYLKIFTELPKEEIGEIIKQHMAAPHERHAQIRLAHEVTGLVHGSLARDQAEEVTFYLIGKQPIAQAGESVLKIIRQEIPALKTRGNGSIIEALAKIELASSNTEARRLITSNAISVNGQKINRQQFEPTDFQNGRLLLRRGKAFKDSALVELG